MELRVCLSSIPPTSSSLLIRVSFLIVKKFPTEIQALDFVSGKPSTSAAVNGSGEGKFYAVAVGHKPGVYADWGEAQKQIQGVRGPKHKKFSTREEAEEFVRNGGRKESSSEAGAVFVEGPAKKKTKTGKNGGANGKGDEDVLMVWTDGSSRGNGKKGAVAGVGVYFGEGDSRYNFNTALEVFIC